VFGQYHRTLGTHGQDVWATMAHLSVPDNLAGGSTRRDSFASHERLSYSGMKISVKKCVALAELWEGDRVVKLDAPFVYRKYEGQDPFSHIDQWGAEEEIPTETSSLYLGTTIAFNKEDEAKHGKHVIDSMKENILAIGRSRLNLTLKFHAIKTFELPRTSWLTETFSSQIFESSTRGYVVRS
jgi:hypothetical protein